jgi:tRNA pseudouridine55 synthase
MDGIILVDKPEGPSSAEIVRKIKAQVKPARVGHLGTLDPFATGVLPILVGEGTKLATFLQEGEKEYEGLIALGSETDTLDKSGAVVRTAAVPELNASHLEEIAERFTGIIEQTPPIYSAIKRAGVALYKRARRGEEVVPPPPRRIEVRRLELKPDGRDAIRFLLVCSPGTYVRSLARDIGIALDSAAHLAKLRRNRSGRFHVADASPLQDVMRALDDGDRAGLIGLRESMPDVAEVAVDAEAERRLRNGDSRALDGLVPPGAKLFKVVARGELVAIAETTSRITARMLRVFNVT